MNRLHSCLVCCAVVVLISACDTASSDPENKDPSSIFPDENLQAASEYALLDDANSALLIWQGGELVFERYTSASNQNFNGQSLHLIFSGSKSFAGILAALAVKNGLFTFDTTLGELITGWDPESRRGEITVRELLNLTSGIQTAPAGMQQTAVQWLNAGMAHERGTVFQYGPTPFYIFSWIFHEEFGINPIDYLDEHLFSKMGLTRGSWMNVNQQYVNLSFGGSYPALDWLQVGVMLMNKGSFNGQEILPEELVHELLRPSDAAPGYGITFLLNREASANKEFAARLPQELQRSQQNTRLISDAAPADLFMKSGLFGQKLYIIPSLDLVIVRLGLSIESAFCDHQFFTRLMQGVETSDT